MFTFGAKANPKIAVAAGHIRVEKAASVKNPDTSPSSNGPQVAPRSQKSMRPNISKPRSLRATPDRLDPKTARKRKPTRQKSPQQPLESSSDEDNLDSPASNYNFPEKRLKNDSVVDLRRQLGAESLFTDRDGEVLIHAADVANQNDHGIDLQLQYPAADLREKYRTFYEKDKSDKIVLRPVDEFIKISEIIADTYLTPEQSIPFTNPEPNPGFLRKLQRAGKLLEQDSLNTEKQQGFIDAVSAYNDALRTLMKEGALSKNLGLNHHVSFKMVDCILDQVYERAVSPRVKILTKMKPNDTKDNTYGELLHNFVTQIISETKLKSDQVFVDLGSGVGNVVLQVALEVGCESWGCEMMEAACELAEAQEREFAVRCRLWGIKPGRVQLERGDFRQNSATIAALRRADVVLVNNEVFDPDLNRNLIDMFLDLKPGCRVVSLKSFGGFQRTTRNDKSSHDILRTEQKEYSKNSVSWKNDGGSYHIATVKRPENFQ